MGIRILSLLQEEDKCSGGFEWRMMTFLVAPMCEDWLRYVHKCNGTDHEDTTRTGGQIEEMREQ